MLQFNIKKTLKKFDRRGDKSPDYYQRRINPAFKPGLPDDAGSPELQPRKNDVFQRFQYKNLILVTTDSTLPLIILMSVTGASAGNLCQGP